MIFQAGLQGFVITTKRYYGSWQSQTETDYRPMWGRMLEVKHAGKNFDVFVSFLLQISQRRELVRVRNWLRADCRIDWTTAEKSMRWNLEWHAEIMIPMKKDPLKLLDHSNRTTMRVMQKVAARRCRNNGPAQKIRADRTVRKLRSVLIVVIWNIILHKIFRSEFRLV